MSRPCFAMDADTYYDVLGVKEGVSPVELKRAFLRMVKRYHPDRNHTADAVAMMQQRAQEAQEPKVQTPAPQLPPLRVVWHKADKIGWWEADRGMTANEEESFRKCTDDIQTAFGITEQSSIEEKDKAENEYWHECIKEVNEHVDEKWKAVQNQSHVYRGEDGQLRMTPNN